MAKLHLHPGARWLFRVNSFFGVLFLVFFIAMFFIAWILNSPTSLFLTGVSLWIFFILLVLILIEVYSRMSYNRWFYEFTDTNLRLERGIIWKRYSNIPYERIQNVDIHRGIIARMLGFSSLMIQTAGYSSYGGRGGMALAEGYIPAVSIDEAEKIREFLIRKISKKSKSGL